HRPSFEVVPLDRALEALPDGDARDLDPIARLEGLDRNGLARGEAALAAELDQVPVGTDAGLAEVAELTLRDLPVGYGLERQLDRAVAGPPRRGAGNGGARPGLDHSPGRDAARLGVEALGHSELPSHDAFHATLSDSREGSSVRASGPVEGVWGNQELPPADI